MPAKVYSDKDADLGVLQNKSLAVLGFGSQGHAHALNLKDSGCYVIIGLYEGTKSVPVAESHGFKVFSTGEAVKRADVIFVAIPDTKQAKAYEQDIAPNLAPGRKRRGATGAPRTSPSSRCARRRRRRSSSACCARRSRSA